MRTCEQASVSHPVQSALYCLPQCLWIFDLAGTLSWQNTNACRCQSPVWSSSYSVKRVQMKPSTTKTVSFARLIFPHTDQYLNLHKHRSRLLKIIVDFSDFIKIFPQFDSCIRIELVLSQLELYKHFSFFFFLFY